MYAPDKGVRRNVATYNAVLTSLGRQRQGLGLVPFSAQPEPFLTQKQTPKRPMKTP